MNVVGHFPTLDATLDACRQRTIDVVVLAEALAGTPVDVAMKEILGSGIRVIALSSDPEPARLTALLSMGAHGYLLDDATPEEVAVGVQAVARGAVAINHTVAAQLLTQWRVLREETASAHDRSSRTLTPREREVLEAMAGGRTASEVARALRISVKTVENHKIRIFEKLGVHSQAHAIMVGTMTGLIGTPPSSQQPGTSTS
jgi:DNA-binding NarL/FixJ family response regulator